MKIALLIDSLGFGGAQRQIVNLAISFKALGHDISFLRYYPDNFYLPLLNEAGIDPITVESKNAIGRIFAIRKNLKRIDPDVVISFVGIPNFCASLASAGKHRWKLITSERIANQGAFKNKKVAFMKSVQARYSDAIVCNSKCAQELWEKYYPKVKHKLSTVYNIIDVPEIATSVKNDGKCRMIVAARYEREKNLDGLLKAVSRLAPEERERLEIHWYGKSNIADATESVINPGKRYIEENSMENCVFLHPATDQIYPLMAESDFVALFSYIEGLPNAVIEGMTLKKPIVMSTVSDYAVLVDESNGFLCDPGSIESIAEALRRAINTTPKMREEMGRRSCEKIGRLCSVESVVSQWEALINGKND